MEDRLEGVGGVRNTANEWFDTFYVDLATTNNLPRLFDNLSKHGLAFFAGIEDTVAFLSLAKSLMVIRPHRDSDIEGITRIFQTEDPESLPGSSHLGFGSGELMPHTDGTSLASPPVLMMLACVTPAAQGGESILVDGAEVHRRLTTRPADMLDALQRAGSVEFGVSPPYRGSVFSVTSSGRLYIRFRYDGFARFSHPVEKWLPTLLSVMNDCAQTVRLTSGQGYVLQNGRWLHGRTAFIGQRRMLRALGTEARASHSQRGTVEFGFAPIP
jgi:alpha-ketoglutarate-dependent taurine dioxygenase